VRNLLLCGLALLALGVSAPARGADLPPAPMYRPVALRPPCTWCGFYVGLNAGGAWADSTPGTFSGSPATAAFFAANEFPTSTQQNPLGFVGGAQVGYNWQVSPAFVFGVETDFQGSKYTGTSTTTPVPIGLATFATQVEQHSNWFGTARARAGVLAWPTVMAYATGGLAYGQTEASLNTFPTAVGCGAVFTCAAGSSTSTRIGWTAGGGFEWLVGHNLTIRAEYLYVDLGSQSVTAISPATAGVCAGGACTFTVSTPFHENVVRGGVNWMFNAF